MSTPKFGGGTKCHVCTKSVYANEELKFENKTYHKLCFKCQECKKVITNLSGVAVIKGVVYDKNCFMKIFKTRGKYNDFGDDNLPKAEAERKKALSVSGDSASEKAKPVSETKPVSESTNVPLVQLKKVGPPAEKSTQPAVEPVKNVESPKQEEEAPKQEEEAPAKQVEVEEPKEVKQEEAPVVNQEEVPAAEEAKPAEEVPAEKPAEEAPVEEAPVAEAVVDVEAPAAEEPVAEAAAEPAAEVAAEPVEVA